MEQTQRTNANRQTKGSKHQRLNPNVDARMNDYERIMDDLFVRIPYR